MVHCTLALWHSATLICICLRLLCCSWRNVTAKECKFSFKTSSTASKATTTTSTTEATTTTTTFTSTISTVSPGAANEGETFFFLKTKKVFGFIVVYKVTGTLLTCTYLE